MAEPNTNDQVLRDEIETLKAEISVLKNKDTEKTIATLRDEVADRDKTIAGLNAQVDAVTKSQAEIQKRAETAEAALAEANKELAAVKTAEAKRAREAILREKHAPDEVIAGLVEQLAVLDDAAFAKTVETISAAWKRPETPKTDPVVAAVNNAKPDEEPALATASENRPEAAAAAVVEFMGSSLKNARGGRPSVFSSNNKDA